MQTFSYKWSLLLISTDEVWSTRPLMMPLDGSVLFPFLQFQSPRQPCLVPDCQTTNQLRPPYPLFQTRAIPHSPEPALAPHRDPQRVQPNVLKIGHQSPKLCLPITVNSIYLLCIYYILL